jgi:hypothetical protein
MLIWHIDKPDFEFDDHDDTLSDHHPRAAADEVRANLLHSNLRERADGLKGE